MYGRAPALLGAGAGTPAGARGFWTSVPYFEQGTQTRSSAPSMWTVRGAPRISPPHNSHCMVSKTSL